MGLKIDAPPWRGEIMYQHSDGHGFEEVYWLTAMTADQAMDDLVAIATARQAMFSNLERVKFWRVSDTNLKGDTQVKQATATTLGTYVVGQGIDMNTPSVGLKVRFQHQDRYWATRILRMLPEDCVTDGQWTPTTAMTTAFNSLKTALVGKTTGVFKGIHEKPAPTAQVVKPLTDIIPLSITTHKAGRPFGLRRARSVLR